MAGRELGRPFTRFWHSYTVSAAGSALGAGALPLVAIVVLQAGPLQVSLLAVVGLVASALLSLPLGAVIERGEKRRALIVADVVQFLALFSVPLVAVVDRLTYLHLCVVAATVTTCSIASAAAGSAFVKAVVVAESRVVANARLDSVNWTTSAVGPPIGGALIGVVGPTVTLLADGRSFLVSALLLRRVPRTRPDAPPSSDPSAGFNRRLWAGWRLILGHRGLRRLYLNALLFGGAYLWTVPLVAVLVLSDLSASAFQYGLLLGIPSVGGLVGALLVPRIASKLGRRRCLLIFGAGRTVGLIPLPFLGEGTGALNVLGVSQFVLLVAAGAFNPLFATYRMTVTPDELMARVGTAWSASSRGFQPICIAVGGLLAGSLSLRWSLGVAAGLCLLSVLFLPWTTDGTRAQGTAARSKPDSIANGGEN
ncbi:MFS transporter [Cryptosporangium phraense]|uniref:MFS transporter n=1 Tax=Cryptosporangium phraense TaxID=2593070 RepID=A0A545ANL3_9ACTN|nr:MFS transporter [Cryptosporangium phraense]TQS42897.1 MFS transporter [Cryptosporangium phraense]